MTSAPAATRYFEQVALPDDPALPRLPLLFDSEWVSQACIERLPDDYGAPERIRIHHFIHSIGRRALVSYEVSWPEDQYLPPEYFVAKTSGDGPVELARYPVDSRLPGLVEAAEPNSVLELANSHVLTMPARRARVQLIRYRPEYRAVLRHRLGRVRLYARVMRPSDVDDFLRTHEVATKTAFVVPGLAGCWREGGVVWLTEIRGRDLRRRIRRRKSTDPTRLLEGLESLWNVPLHGCAIRPFSLKRAYDRAMGSFRHNLREDAESTYKVNAVAEALNPFVESWRPSHMAHNDFYDDQLLLMENGRIALVDLEDIGPGDPMLDVGNFLAHLRWSSQSSNQDRAANCRAYHEEMRRAALDRFQWDAHNLALREAVCLFRICTNIIRHPKPDWIFRLDAGLELVGECLN
ncbi:MAG: phosphotransferase [Chloroflexota bacterium]|nr:phosphotransferase [Chloroflexota bacterium]MDE2908373.1 phosphotransferase [Chloroflexota bacterium]